MKLIVTGTLILFSSLSWATQTVSDPENLNKQESLSAQGSRSSKTTIEASKGSTSARPGIPLTNEARKESIEEVQRIREEEGKPRYKVIRSN